MWPRARSSPRPCPRGRWRWRAGGRRRARGGRRGRRRRRRRRSPRPWKGSRRMCGIVGYVGDKSPAELILEGLKKLEYRGYDSAGVAVLGAEGLQVRRAAGRIKGLEALMRERPVAGSIGGGATARATAGPTHRADT